MLTHIEDDVPEFLLQRETVAFCSQLHVNKTKSSLLLSRNLKFYEFRKKELVHQIDLRSSSCMVKLTTQLQSYSGPISSFLIRDDVTDTSGDSTSYSMLHPVEELPLSIGKYVWLGEHIYLLLRCWQTLLVLERPSEHGASFKLIAQHENVEEYRLVRGGAPVQYQAYVELHFVNGKRQRTNFQNPDSADSAALGSSSSCSAAGFECLMQRVHGARAELHTQRAQTQVDFVRARDLHAFGAPGQRSPLLEEKKLLRRCSDVWMRICNDALVLGTLLTNTSGSQRSSMLHCIRPLVRLFNGDGINYAYRLYELPLQADGQPPENYDELAQFWACQDQFSISLSWRPTPWANQLPPERSAVLLVRIQLADLLSVDQMELLALYELPGVGQRQQQLQLKLASISVASVLQCQEQVTPIFAPHTLHKDFLALLMTQTAHCALRLQFPCLEQQMQFEQLLINKLEFSAIAVPQEQQLRRQQPQAEQLLDETSAPQEFTFANNNNDNNSSTSSSTSSSSDSPTTVQRIFYNRKSQLLFLRKHPCQHWHIYASSQTHLCLLLRRMLRDLLKLNCNLSLLELHENAFSVPANTALLLESALRDELQARTELLQVQPPQAQLSASALKRLHQLEMATDLLVLVINSQMQQESH